MVKLPEIQLDDRGFQELVSEARTRITQHCPEWTEHNVSDPGITLIELFAWMTEMTTYRLNRVPDKIYIRMLEILGIPLRPATPATTRVRFMLAEPPTTEAVEIEAGGTEVGTVRTQYDESVVFEVTQGRVIPPLVPSAYVTHRDGEIRDIPVDVGVARPIGPDRAAFSATPQPGDALHLGFDEPISQLVIRVTVEADPARGAGVDPRNPPLRWEVATGEKQAGEPIWEHATVLEDTTGGFNFGNGEVFVEFGGDSDRVALGGHRLHWLRCRVASPQEVAEVYEHPPHMHTVTALPIGATLACQHAERVEGESLGESDGTPGQTFTLLNRPVLAPAEDDFLEVRESYGAEWQRWSPVDSFADHGPEDRVYVCDPTTGTIELGPAIREADGAWHHFGAVPPKGAMLRMSRYRHGGGLQGNVAAGALSVLKAGPAGIAGVTNPVSARGGVDPEPLDSLRLRGAMELRSRHRAVTAEDFEHLAREASPRVARAVCLSPDEGSAVTVRVLPDVHPADRRLEFDELQPSRELLEEVAAHLDDRRLLGATVQVAPVRLRGVSVVIELQTEPLADIARIREQTLAELYRFLNPIVGGTPGASGEGWEFGRTLNLGELYGVVHAVQGVEYVRLLRMYSTDMTTGRQSPEPVGSHLVLAPDETIASGRHVVKATMRGT